MRNETYLAYAAVTRDEAQRSIRPLDGQPKHFYHLVILASRELAARATEKQNQSDRIQLLKRINLEN